MKFPFLLIDEKEGAAPQAGGEGGAPWLGNAPACSQAESV
jgi:hypothetical protein